MLKANIESVLFIYLICSRSSMSRTRKSSEFTLLQGDSFMDAGRRRALVQR